VPTRFTQQRRHQVHPMAIVLADSGATDTAPTDASLCTGAAPLHTKRSASVTGYFKEALMLKSPASLLGYTR